MLKDTYPYFILDGRAEEAVRFYADVFDAKVLDTAKFKDVPDTPDQATMVIPEEAKELVMNATIQLPNGSCMMFADNYPGTPYTLGTNITLTLVYENPEETRAVFDKLKVDGKVEMEPQKTFWSPLYANVIDKFGVQWQISTTDEEHPM